MAGVNQFPDEHTRFWSRVRVAGPDECWEWIGALNNKGYGRFGTYPKSGTLRHLAHRYVLAERGELDPALTVLHVCDNPACVNPRHLSQGTQLDNIRDCLSKGRMDLSGLQADTPKKCARCGTPFMGSPSRRYCEPHRPARKRLR